MTGFKSKKAAALDEDGMYLVHQTAQPAQGAAAFIAAEERKVGTRYGYVPKLHPSEYMDDDDDTQVYQQAKPAQEPVCPECKAGVLYECVACSSNNYPPQRPWVNLTDEEIADYLGDEYHDMTESELRFFRLGEAAAKEKNT
jgi:hypothetical protein